MDELDITLSKIVDPLEYHFFMIDEMHLNEIKILVKKCHYHDALWSLIDHLDPTMQEFEDFLPLLWKSWFLVHKYNQSKLEEVEEFLH